MSMIVGAVLGMYTGVLLSSFSARPLWNTPLLSILFLTSGLSSAAALVHMISKDEDESRTLAKADNAFLIAEIIIIAFLLIGMLSSSQAHIDSAHLILGGDFTVYFWVFVMGMGIIVPLIIQLYAVNDKINHQPLAPIFVMLGGLLLRFIFVAAGQASHWSTAVFK